MGNGVSNCEFVQIAKQTYLPGETVKGTFYLLVISGVTVDSVKINVRGFESIFWQDSVPDHQAIDHNRLSRQAIIASVLADWYK